MKFIECAISSIKVGPQLEYVYWNDPVNLDLVVTFTRIDEETARGGYCIGFRVADGSMTPIVWRFQTSKDREQNYHDVMEAMRR